MGIYRHFPYTNFHEMNLDEIINTVQNLQNEWLDYTAQWASGIETESLLTPEMFGAKGDGSTDDSDAFQQIFDLLNNKGGTVVLKNTYLIASPVVVKRHSDFVIPITFIGLGAESTLIVNNPISGASNDYGNIKFINVTFKGTRIFQCDRKLIRIVCQSCTFDSVNAICVATNVCQSVYFIDCIIRYCNYVIDASNSDARCYDIKITGCLIEWGYRVFYCPNSPSYETVITNNCIEGLTGSVAEFNITRSAVISNNYFEQNDEYIVLHHANTNNVVIENNSIVEPNAKTFVVLPTSVTYPASVKIINNNVSDPTTPFSFISILSGGQTYSGLQVEGNNKIDSPRIGRAMSSIEINETAPFEVTITREESPTYSTVEDALRLVAQYAKTNYRKRALFSLVWNQPLPASLADARIINGVVSINTTTNRIYLAVFDNTNYRMGVMTYVYSTLLNAGAYHSVLLQI